MPLITTMYKCPVVFHQRILYYRKREENKAVHAKYALYIVINIKIKK